MKPKFSSSSQIRGLVFALSAALFLSGCATHFVSAYDATSLEKLTSLKVFHLRFIDDFTEGKGKTFDAQKLKTVADDGDLKFSEAEEYAIGLGDQTRVQSIKILHEQFTNTCQELQQDKKLLFKDNARDTRRMVALTYDQAIKMESARLNLAK